MEIFIAMQSSNKCLADTCGALHCDYFDDLSSLKPKAQATCKPAVVEKNRHACEVGKLEFMLMGALDLGSRTSWAKAFGLSFYDSKG